MSFFKRISKKGKRKDLENIYFRSSWEANYARFLNFCIKRNIKYTKWEFEKKEWFFPVKRGNTNYKADFTVYCKDGSVEYHEVKGWLDHSSAIKLKRMAKYYPKIKIVLVSQIEYKLIKKQFSKYIRNWE